MPTARNPLTSLPPFDSQTDEVNIIIETPKGSRNKYDYDPERRLFILKKVLPAGTTFPYDFGYIPSTKGEDGDPLDVLVLMDEKAFPGCYLTGRLIGAIRAEQTEDGETIRNDRLIAVASCSHDQHNIQSIDQLNQHLVKEIEHFFVSYNEMQGRLFEPQSRLGSEKARKLVEKATVAKSRNGAVRHRARK